jgi:capsid protein
LRNRTLGWRGPATEPTGEVSQQLLADGSTRQLEGLSPGMEILSAPGETLSGFSPSVVNADFVSHVRLILQLIGINLGLPLVMVLMDASETNFSGWRGAVDEARRHFRRNQRHLICKFHTPVYQWKVRQWLAEDSALARAAKRSKIDIFGHRWNRPGWPYIDPLKDVGADLLEESNGLISPRRLHARKGAEFKDIWRETIEDNSARIAAAMAATILLNKKAPPGQEVHWREVASLPLAKGLTVKLDASEDAPPAAPAKKKTAGAA